MLLYLQGYAVKRWFVQWFVQPWSICVCGLIVSSMTSCTAPTDLDTPSVSTQIFEQANNRFTPGSIIVEAWQTGRDSLGSIKRARWQYDIRLQTIQLDTTGMGDGRPPRLWVDCEWRIPGFRITDTIAVRPNLLIATSISAVRFRMDSVRCGTRQNIGEEVSVTLTGSPDTQNGAYVVIPVYSFLSDVGGISARFIQDTARIYANTRPNALQADATWQVPPPPLGVQRPPRVIRGNLRFTAPPVYAVQWEAQITLTY